MRKLSEYPALSGLARNKITVFAIIICSITVGLLFYGTSLQPDADVSVADNNNQTYNSSINQSPDLVMTKVTQELAKMTASSVMAESDNAGLLALPATTAKPADTKHTNNNSIVTIPAISDTDAQQFKTQQVQIENQFKLKRMQNSTLAYSSKSIAYQASKIKASGTEAINDTQLRNTSITAPGVQELGPNDIVPKITMPAANNSDQNKQQEKQNFAANSADKTVNGLSGQYLSSRIIDLESPYVLSAGSVIPSTMISGLNSDLPGEIVGIVRENVFDSPTHKILLIPQGSKLIGLYDSNISYGQERILVAWNRLIYPTGSSINLKAMPGTDLEGYAGFHDEVNNHYWKIFGSSFIMGVITGAMQYSQNNTNANAQAGGVGFTNTNPTLGQSLSGSLGQQLGQTGLSITEKNLNIQPTLIVKPGYPFNVLTTADMILRPYRKG